MTPIGKYQFSVPELTDIPDVPSHLTSLATQIDDLLSGAAPTQLGIANSVLIGDPTQTTDSMLQISKVSAGVVLLNRHRVFPTGSGGGQGTIASNEIYENGAEVASLNFRRDGQLFLKSGGPSGASRPLPFAIASGFVNVPVGGVNYGTADWVFPSGRFSLQPLVLTTSTNSLWIVGIAGGDVTKVTVYARSWSGSVGGAGGSVGVHILAIQMLPTSNQG